MQTSYIHIIYSKRKILLVIVLVALTILVLSYQVTVNLFPKTQTGDETEFGFFLRRIFSPQKVTPVQSWKEVISPSDRGEQTPPPFSQEKEEEMIAKIQNLSIEEIREQLLEKAPEELNILIKTGVISEETMRELLMVFWEKEKIK